MNLNSSIVDCGWATWSDWGDCTKEASGTCGEQGGGTRERTRTKSFEGANGGEECEADSMEESWSCCANSTTDATGCTDPTEVCLPGNEINLIREHRNIHHQYEVKLLLQSAFCKKL